ncbi:proteoglycan 4-like [Uloborus diversus]|uniref:proteoglycan 4-like n=1 Tax=Uloborus diversus TaxID=327109 RepID=UPI0024090C88|nr:proteoglycan 4-like [Uloborus diversus]
MRRGGPPQAQGAATPLALQSSEFEDFMNAYRPTLELPRPPPPKPPEESKLRKFMRKSSVLNKSRKEGVQRTPNDREKSVGTEVDKKPKRPLSAVVEGTPLQTIVSEPEAIPSSKNPKQSISRTGRNGSEEQQLKVPAALEVPKSAMPRTAKMSDQDMVSDIKIPVPTSKPPIPAAGPVPKSPTAKSSKLAQEQEQKSTVVASPKPSTSKLSKSALEQESVGKTTVLLPPPKKASVAKAMKNGGDEYITRVVPESTVVLNTASPIPKKKVSIQDDRRISAVEDALCLIISGNNIGRFLPPRHLKYDV